MKKFAAVFFILWAANLSGAKGFSSVVSDVDVEIKDASVQVQVVAASPLKYKVMEMKNPFRIVVDMPSSMYPKISKSITLDAYPVSKVRLQQFQKTIVRLVIDLEESQLYQVNATENGFLVSVSRVKEPAPEVLGNTPAPADEAMLTSPADVTAIELKKEGNKILVSMKGSGKLKYHFKEVASPPSFSVMIPKAKLSASPEEIFVDALGVQRIVPSQKKEDVFVTVYLNKMLPSDISLIDDQKTVLLTIEGETKQKEKEKVAQTVTKKEEKKKEEKKTEPAVVTEVKKEVKKEEKKEEKKTSDIKGPQITSVDAQEKDNKVSVSILSTEALQYGVKELKFPSRLELTFKGAWAKTMTETQDVNKGAVRSVSVRQSKTEPPEAKVMVNLVRMAPYEVNLENDGRKIVLTFETTKEVNDVLAKEKEAKEKSAETKTETKTNVKNETQTENVVVAPVETKKKKSEQKKKEALKVPVVVKEMPKETKKEVTLKTSSASMVIKSVDIKKLQDRILLYITGTSELRYKIRESENPDKVIFEFYNAMLGMKEKSMDVNQGNVTKARAYQSQKVPVPVVRVALDLEAKTKYEAQLTPEKKQLLVTAEAPKAMVPVVKKIKKTTSTTKLPSLPLPQLPALPPYTNDKINMDFKDADVRDVLRIFGEITGMNIIVAPDVPSGILITLSLKDVPLGQAIDMVVNSVGSSTATSTGTTTTSTTSTTTGTTGTTGNNLKYRIIGNTIVVSFSQNILDQMGSGVLAGDLTVETFAIKGYTRTEFTSILRKIAPELTVIDTPDRPKDLITTVGPKTSLQRAKALILGLTPVPEVEVETFNVGNLDPSDVETALKSAIPEASVVDKKKGNPPNFISVSGASHTLKKVEKFTADLTLKQNVTFDVVTTRETKPDEIEKLLKSFVPGVQVVRSLIGTDTYSTTIAGTADEITAAKKLIENLEGGAGRKNTAMTVESIQLKHIDTVTSLQEQGVDIEALLRNLVPGLSDNAKIFLDKRNNTITVSASLTDIEKVKKAVEKIDVKVPQVSIEAKVIDFTTSGAKSFSANFVQQITGTPPAKAITMTSGGNFVGTGTFTFNMLGGTYIGTLNDLVQQGKARVLASPKILALSGKSATITLTDQVPYTVENSTVGQFGQVVVTKNTSYEPVGITLTLTPRINSDGEILLQINPKVETITSTPAPGQRPSKNSREVNTLMRIGDGGSVIIGGLINSSERETMAKIPLLSGLPLVGKLFKATSTTKSDSELSIIIQANIVEE